LFADVFFFNLSDNALMNSSSLPTEGRASAAGQSPEVESISRRSFLGVLLGFVTVVVREAKRAALKAGKPWPPRDQRQVKLS
jgi:hypothetical protein